MISAFEEIFIIIDECKERQELLAKIEEFCGCIEININIMTTSRREKVIEESMESMTVEQEQVDLQSTLVNPNIRAYVRS